jgi:hypothetical protein
MSLDTHQYVPSISVCNGTYIDMNDGQAPFINLDRVHMNVDCIDFDSVFIHLEGDRRGHEATIELSAEEARYLAMLLKKAAKVAEVGQNG